MNDDEIRLVHNVTLSKFRKKHSVAYGSLGPSIAWYYHFDDGETLFGMEMSQKGFKNSIEYYGIYSGQGCVTSDGPLYSHQGPNSLGLSITNEYDFNFQPIDYPDLIFQLHDGLQNQIVDAQGWLEDTRTLMSNQLLVYLAENAPNKMSDDAIKRIHRIKVLFTATIAYKECKVEQITKQYGDPNDPHLQQYFMLSDWHPKIFSKEWKYKIILNLSGGGKTKEEMEQYCIDENKSKS